MANSSGKRQRCVSNFSHHITRDGISDNSAMDCRRGGSQPPFLPGPTTVGEFEGCAATSRACGKSNGLSKIHPRSNGPLQKAQRAHSRGLDAAVLVDLVARLRVDAGFARFSAIQASACSNVTSAGWMSLGTVTLIFFQLTYGP